MQTTHVEIFPPSHEQLRALADGPGAFQREFGLALAAGILHFLPPDALAKMERSNSSPDWKSSYFIVHKADRAVIGLCGYKSPPDTDGVVEIAYAIAPSYEGLGYATEAARYLTANAFCGGRVKIVRAHTLPESNASTRVLAKCGFAMVGEVIDPEDGKVWRWEKQSPR